MEELARIHKELLERNEWHDKPCPVYFVSGPRWAAAYEEMRAYQAARGKLPCVWPKIDVLHFAFMGTPIAVAAVAADPADNPPHPDRQPPKPQA